MLNKVDLPTFGKPTIPIFSVFDGRPQRQGTLLSIEAFFGGIFNSYTYISFCFLNYF